MYYGLHQDRQTISVSVQDKNLVKIRTFTAPTGVRVDEWAVAAEANFATVSGFKVFLISKPSDAQDQISVTTFNLKTSVVEVAAKKYSLPTCAGLSAATGPYFICGKGNSVSVLNLEEGTVTSKKFEDIVSPDEISQISTSGSGPIPGVVFQGAGFAKGFLLIEDNSKGKSGPELFPLNILPSGSAITLSQFSSEEKPLLFVARLENSHSIKMEAYNRNGQRVEGSSVAVKASMPLSLLLRVQGYLLNNKYGLTGVTKDELVFGTKAGEVTTIFYF